MKNKKVITGIMLGTGVVSCSGGGLFNSEGTPRSFPTPTISVKDERNTEKQKYNGTNVKTDIGTNKDELSKYVSNNPTYKGIDLSEYNEGTRIGGTENKHIKTVIDGREVEYNTVSELIHNTNYDNPFDRGLGHNVVKGVIMPDKNKPYINFNNPLNLPEVGANTKYTGKGVDIVIYDGGFWKPYENYKPTDDAFKNSGMKYTVEKLNFGAVYDYNNYKYSNHGIEVTKVAFDIARNSNYNLFDVDTNNGEIQYTPLTKNKKYDIINLSNSLTKIKEKNWIKKVGLIESYFKNEINKGSLIIQSAGNDMNGAVNIENFSFDNIYTKKGHILVGGLTTYPKYKNPKYLTQDELKHFSPSTPEGKYHFITAMGQMEISSGGWFWGTSGATPTVTGIAALVKEKYPWMTNEDLKMTLLTTATDIGEKGVDVIYGWGLVNADRALNGPKYLDKHLIVYEDGYARFRTSGLSIFSNNIEGDGGLYKSGPGTLVLAGDNLYKGGTYVDNGELYLKNGINYSTIRNANATLTLDNVKTNDIVITGKQPVLNINNENNTGTLYLGADDGELDALTINVNASSKLKWKNVQEKSLNAAKRATLIYNTSLFTPKNIDIPLGEENNNNNNNNNNNVDNMPKPVFNLSAATVSVNNKFYTAKAIPTGIRVERKDANEVLNKDGNEKVVADNINAITEYADTHAKAQGVANAIINTDIDSLNTMSGQIYSSSQDLTFKEQDFINRIISNKLAENEKGINSFASVSTTKATNKNQGYGDSKTTTNFGLIGVTNSKDNLTYGMAFNYGKGKTDFNNAQGNAKIETTGVNVFAKLENGNLYNQARIGATVVKNKTTREVVNNTSVSERNDVVLSGSLETGYVVKIKNNKITPYVKQEIASVKRGAINENVDFGINANAKRINTYTLGVGTRFDSKINNTFEVGSYVEYSRVFAKDLDFVGRYNGIDRDITVKGNNLSKNKLSLGVNAKANITNKFNVYTNYDINRESNKHTNHMVTFGFNYKF